MRQTSSCHTCAQLPVHRSSFSQRTFRIFLTPRRFLQTFLFRFTFSVLFTTMVNLFRLLAPPATPLSSVTINLNPDDALIDEHRRRGLVDPCPSPMAGRRSPPLASHSLSRILYTERKKIYHTHTFLFTFAVDSLSTNSRDKSTIPERNRSTNQISDRRS